MPELPEVESYRRRFDAQAIGRTVGAVEITDAGVLRGSSPEDLTCAAEGRAFSEVRRHGKILFARLGDGPWLILHFGMTGDLVLVAPDEESPEHARVIFTFRDGGRLAFVNPRKFGWLELAEDVQSHLDGTDIGPDALSLSRQELGLIIRATRGLVKPALMDQSKLAGIGNVYSDEILFRARIRPDSKGADLTDTALDALHQALRAVLETASERLSRGTELPGDWLARHREDGARCPRCGGELARKKIAGRTARFCPACQDGGDG